MIAAKAVRWVKARDSRIQAANAYLQRMVLNAAKHKTRQVLQYYSMLAVGHAAAVCEMEMKKTKSCHFPL